MKIENIDPKNAKTLKFPIFNGTLKLRSIYGFLYLNVIKHKLTNANVINKAKVESRATNLISPTKTNAKVNIVNIKMLNQGVFLFLSTNEKIFGKPFSSAIP